MKKLIAIFVAILLNLGAVLPLHAVSVNVDNGNIYEQVWVSPLPKLPAIIAYNSKSEQEGVVGYGWNACFDIRLLINSDGSCVLIDQDGSEKMFIANSDGSFTAEADNHDILEKHGDSFCLNRKNGGHAYFDTNGKAITIVDSNANARTLVYDNEGKLAMLVGPNNEELILTTDSLGRITAITSAEDKSFSFTYDNDNNLTAITDPAGQTTIYGYDAAHNRIAKTNPAGQTNNYSYDNQDRLVSTTNSAGETRSLEYVNDTLTRLIDPAGNVTEYTYDGEQHITSKKDAAGNITASTWDDAGNKISVMDASGTVRLTYDDKGNIISYTDQLGQLTSYTYNDLARVTSITDPSGAVNTFTYDANGNMLSSIDALDNATSYTYDSQGRIISVTDALGQMSTLAYDSHGNATTFINPLGAITTMVHDMAGNMTALTDALGNTTAFTYDELNRLLAVTDPKGNVTSCVYDTLGNQVAVTDANGNTTRYEYNQGHQVTRIIDALNQVTTITYLANNKYLPASLTDANGQTTTFAYDSLGHLIRETDSLGKTITYQYDAIGNIITRNDSAGNIITYTYDALGRLLFKTFPDGTSASFSYDEKGHILTAANQHIAYNMTYDPLGQLLSITDSDNHTITYKYDKLGNLIQMTMPDGDKIDYNYNKANRLTAISSFVGDFTFSYDKLDRRIKLNFPNNITNEYSYDTLGLLTDIITRNDFPHGFSRSLIYSHDAVGNRLSKTLRAGSKSHDRFDRPYAADHFDYTYDSVYRLLDTLAVRETRHKARKLFNRFESFSFDPVGNRLSGPEWDEVYTYNRNNQLLSTENYTFFYDANGNLSQKIAADDDNQENCTYEYDFENRLIKVTKTEEDSSKTVSFKYDPFGRRIEKQVAESGNHAPSRHVKICTYVYDNEDIILEIYSGDNDAAYHRGIYRKFDQQLRRKKAVHSSVNRFVHGPGIDEPLALEQNGRVYFYHADGLGSITSLTNMKGQMVETYEYDSFGKILQYSKTNQPYAFTGREWDSETGLYFFRARYYNPKIGRFISKDPIGFAGGVNHYAYAEANPIRFIDPFGLTIWKCKRPLGGKPGERTPPVFNHRYNCITTQDGSVKCDSTNAPPEWPNKLKRGVPSRSEDDYYHKDACEEVDDNKDQCVEQCLQNQWQKPRPPYDIGPYGTDCQEYSSDSLQNCIKLCLR